MQNEANFANWGGAWERRGERAKQSQSGGPIVQNEPSSGAARGRDTPTIPVFHHSSIPIRCRSRKTKPISDGTRVRLVIVAAPGYHDGVPMGMAQAQLKKV